MKDYRQQKNGIAFPVALHQIGSERINVSHGGTMPRMRFVRGTKIPPTDYVSGLTDRLFDVKHDKNRTNF